MAKRGRKKKRPSRLSHYKILVINNGKQIDYLGCYKTAREANTAFLQFLRLNESVMFPVEYLNTSNKDSIFMDETNYEIIIVKRKNETDNDTTHLRNEYGEYIEYKTTSDTWILYDKAPYKLEETFWVYGYNPFQQRKTFQFIVENIVEPRVKNKETMLEMRIYQNKLLLETTNDTNMVICKNKSDCIRLYNTIERWCDEKKYKYLIPCGLWKGKNAIPIINKIMELTGWDKSKVLRTKTVTNKKI